jgi:hypothetical protein
MVWTIFVVPSTRKGDLEAVLRDDQLSRQSQKVRDAASAGGESGKLYVVIEGSPEAVRRADELLGSVGSKLPGAEADTLYRRFREEDESASAGMGLFFTEE